MNKDERDKHIELCDKTSCSRNINDSIDALDVLCHQVQYFIKYKPNIKRFEKSLTDCGLEIFKTNKQ